MLDVEVGIYIHDGVVAYLFFVLYAELSQCGIEHGGVLLREEAHVHTYLYIQCFDPRIVVV